MGLILALMVLLMEREKQMQLLMQMLKQMLVFTVLALSLPQPLSAVVFLSGLVTRFLSTDQGRLQRLFARLSLTSRSSRTVLTLSAPLAPSNLSSNLIPLLLLEVTLRLDLLLLLLTMEQSQWAVLVLLVDMELVPLSVDTPVVLFLVPLSVDTPVVLFLVILSLVVCLVV